MNTTPEIEATLNELTEMCCGVLSSEATLDSDRVKSLTQNLSTNGWQRHTSDAPPLSTILKNRIKEQCVEPAMHRGAAIDGVVQQVQAAYKKASAMHASSPSDDNHSQAMPPRSTA